MISVVIPAFNEEASLGRCLEALCVQTVPPDEVIVVDNASTDDTASVAITFEGRLNVRVVPEPQKGLTYARQAGLTAAQGNLIAYVDADTNVPPAWCNIIKTYFAYDENLVCLSGPCDYYDLPFHQRIFCNTFWWLFALPTYWMVGYMVVGGNFATRRSTLLKIGGFDTSIAFYGEDTDIARRLAQCGKVRFDPRFLVQSSGRRLAQQGIVSTAILYTTNYLSEVLLHKPTTRTYEDLR